MIELEAVRKSYSGSLVLKNVTLRLPKGATTVLIGPSGCGKSTLLRLMIGLTQTDSGKVRFDGQVVSAYKLLALRKRMGYVIQEGGLFPHLTAAENAALMAHYLKWPQVKIYARLQELGDLVHLPDACLSRYPRELSGGQRQRVSLMRALMLDPEVLLMDEPLAALDPMIRAELQTDLRDIFKRLGKTVCWVTHDLAEAAYFSRHIVLMRDGVIVQAGAIEELQQNPASEFVQHFVNAQRQLAGQAV